MNNVEKMKRERSGIVAEMRKIQTEVDARADQSITADEKVKFNELRSKVDEIDGNISRAEFLAKQEEAVALRSDPDKQKAEFRSMGEWLGEIINNPTSSALERRTTTLGNKPAAGYLVPDQFDQTLRAASAESEIVRPRALIIPSGDAPEAVTNLISLDQTGDKGIHAGLKMHWVSEIGQRPNAGDLPITQIQLQPNTISAYMDVSNTLYNNYEALGALLQSRLSLATASAFDEAFMVGDNVGKPSGFVAAPCNATAPRTTAGKITFDDIVNMISLTLTGGEYIFIVSRSAMPQVLTMKDSAGSLIFQPSARDGIPGTLLGLPVVFSEKLPTVGTQGDIVLCNLQAYAIKEGTNPVLLVDVYTQAGLGTTRIYYTQSIDGRPLLTTPIKGADRIDRSYFVTLI